MDTKDSTAVSASGYALLDSGFGEKLERFGTYVLARPDPQALWEKSLPDSEWKKADAWYERKGKEGKWHMRETLPREWSIEFGGFTFLIRPTSFKHVGLFPEQLFNWNWLSKELQSTTYHLPPKILNLFAYTGGATLACAKVGAEVVHLDASKPVVEWARKNAELSGLSEKPIRWIVEDALTFVKREVKRGNRYEGIIMDPPAFGHGPKDELWKIEEHFLPLMKLCCELLSEKPLFFLMSGYASGYSSLVFSQNLLPLKEKFGGTLSDGELLIQEAPLLSYMIIMGNKPRMLPCGIFARWSRN